MNKSNRYIAIVLFITGSIFYIQGCETDRCFHGTGTNTKMRITTGYFDTLNVMGLFHIILVQDSINYVEFEGGEKVLEYVNATNSDSTLFLENSNSCFFFRDYEKIKAFVHFQTLSKLNIYEVCELESYDSLTALRSVTMQADMAEISLLLNVENFSFYNNRTTGGKFTFTGKVDRCRISAYYTAKYITRDLFVRDFYVNNSSLSDMYVNATERLQVKILHKGNIYYSDSPEIVIDSLSGTGQLIPWNND